MCQGLIAPQFASADLGLAEKLAIRAVATATGAGLGQVAARVREAGGLGQAHVFLASLEDGIGYCSEVTERSTAAGKERVREQLDIPAERYALLGLPLSTEGRY